MELINELLAVECASRPSSRASRRRLLLETVRVVFIDFFEWGFEDEWIAVADGVDKIWGNDGSITGGAEAGKNIDNWRGLGGGPVNGNGKLENDEGNNNSRSKNSDEAS